MNIKYNSHIIWKINLSKFSQSNDVFSAKTFKKITATERKLNEMEYVFRFENVTNDLLDEFIPKYEEYISSKKNPAIHNIRSITMYNTNHDYSYQSLSLYHKEKLVGALLFTVREKRISTAFKFYPKQLEIKLPISVTMVAERILLDYAFMLKKNYLYHGVDRNCYGDNAEIGLAMTKLQVGCLPYVPTSQQYVSYTNYKSSDHDSLVFLACQKGKLCKKALLYTNIIDKNILREKYGALLGCSAIETTIMPRINNHF